MRPVRPDERGRWDELMREHHYPGFRQFAGRGLRQVAVWRRHRLALLVVRRVQAAGLARPWGVD